MAWAPGNDFEEEVVSLQPDYNFIFGALPERETNQFFPRPTPHIALADKRKKHLQQSISTDNVDNEKLRIIATVQEIARTKPLGEMPTIHDWDNTDNVEQETVAMMRHFGLGPCTDQPLVPEVTLPTLPLPKESYIMQYGRKRMPIILDEKYFELKPRVRAPSPITDLSTSNTSTRQSDSTTGYSYISSETNDKDVDISQVNKPSYEKLFNDSNNSVASESLSDADSSIYYSADCSTTSGDYMNWPSLTNHKVNNNNRKGRAKRECLPKLRVFTPREIYEKKRHA